MDGLDPGARLEDLDQRARALRTEARSVRLVRVGHVEAVDASHGEWAADPEEAVSDGEWSAALRSAISPRSDATLVLSGPAAIAQAAKARRVWPGEIRLWPTTLSGEPTRDLVALDCAVAAMMTTASTRVSLWDGDYVLVPGSPEAAGVDLVLDAFARVVEEASSLDLVMLDPGADAGRARARELGVRWRAHWAGPSPLRAEVGWLSGCAAVVLTDREAANLPLVLRAMASGSSLLVAGPGSRARALHGWLAGQGATAHELASGAEGLARALSAAIAAEAPVRAACGRAAEIARARDGRGVAAGLREQLQSLTSLGEAA